MLLPFPLRNPIKISIPTHDIFFLFLLLITILPQALPSPPHHKSVDTRERRSVIGARTAGAMKVYPVPSKKRNITVQYRPRNASVEAQTLVGVVTHHNHHKKLRRLPHIFSRVLELPFRADADVEVEEGPGFFRFVAETDEIGSDVRAHTVEIHPGVTKIVVRPNGSLELLSLDQLELDMWRFRLPESTRPELASAVCVDGELIVTVPKGSEEEEDEEAMESGGHGGGGDGDVWGGGNGNRLVIVQ